MSRSHSGEGEARTPEPGGWTRILAPCEAQRNAGLRARSTPRQDPLPHPCERPGDSTEPGRVRASLALLPLVERHLHPGAVLPVLRPDDVVLYQFSSDDGPPDPDHVVASVVPDGFREPPVDRPLL